MIARTFALVVLFLGSELRAGQIVDLGSLEIQAKMRGPEIGWVEANEIDKGTSRKLLQQSLREIEKELLKPAPPEKKP